jgi:hypothetical protein
MRKEIVRKMANVRLGCGPRPYGKKNSSEKNFPIF